MTDSRPLALLAVFALVTAAPAQWGQFRGPGGAGLAPAVKLPEKLSLERHVRWKVPVGPGMSSPVVAGDLLVLTSFEGGKLFTVAFDKSTGSERWRREAPAQAIEAFHPVEGSPAASTPATDGTRVVSYFGSAGLFAYDLTGKPLWDYPLPCVQTHSDFGTGTSPVVAGGKVILVRDIKADSVLIALDIQTGKEAWKVSREKFPTAYASPAVWDNAGVPEVVVPGFGQLVGYDLATGAKRWSLTGFPSVCCTTSVPDGGVLYFAGWSPGGADFQMPKFDDLLKADANGDGSIDEAESANTFIKGFFKNNDMDKNGKIERPEWDQMRGFLASGTNVALAVKPGVSGDGPAAQSSYVAWRHTKGLPYVPSPLVFKGQVLFANMGGQLTALDAKTGKPVYAQERVGVTGGIYASPIAVGDRVVLASLDGTLVVIDSDTEPTIAAKVKFGERIAATPAVSGDALIVRTEKHLYAIGTRD